MLLTVAMIARNEGKRIGASLEAVRGIADQIVVVDSGSTDDTASVARAHGAIVVPFEWCDDFAAARNAAYPHIRGRWTFWIDADEVLDRTTCDELPKMLARNDTLGFGVFRRDYMGGFKPGQPGGKFVTSVIFRILRNDLGIRFTGRCHEQPDPPPDELAAATGLRAYSSPVTLDHDCDYYFDGRFRKASRNGRLLEMEVRERPGRLYWMIQAGATLLDVPESRERGHEIMRDALRLIASRQAEAKPPMSMVEIALEYAAHAPASDNLPLSPDEAAALAEKWFPNAAPVIWMRARRAFQSEDYETAIPILKRLLHMGETRSYDIEVPFDGAIVGDDARLNLGACYIRLGEIDQAEAVLKQIDPTGPRGEEARLNLMTIEKVRETFPE